MTSLTGCLHATLGSALLRHKPLNTITSGQIHCQLIPKRGVLLIVILLSLCSYTPLRLPIYEASHEFDKRGRRQQPPQAPIAPPRVTEPPRLPPPIMNNVPPYLNRGYSRDSFRAPPSTRPDIPPPSGHQNLYPQPLDFRGGMPMNLPPIHYPAQGPPPAPYQFPNVLTAPLQPDQKPRISHLPPRPPMPMGLDSSGDGRLRVGGRDNNQRTWGERDRNHGGLNYG